MSNFVHQAFTLWAVGTEIDSHCGFLAYGKDAPGVVEIVLPHHDGSGEATSYVVDRALLAIGLQRQASNGAIVVRPHNTRADWLIITLAAPGGAGDFYADAVVMRQFLAATAELVPMEVAA
ncbi:SsgA family sporulation/cell division regulator [Nonomuraea bangladeshensis]|uniref:SsgA family sporulation/cell division regulator n=1 Tax=Nonomuraea bangladeshensis TaxID=404385 RepID=UPI0031DAE2DF